MGIERDISLGYFNVDFSIEIIQHSMVGWKMNDEQEGIWKEVVVV
jgi:hypothetical protein